MDNQYSKKSAVETQPMITERVIIKEVSKPALVTFKRLFYACAACFSTGLLLGAELIYSLSTGCIGFERCTLDMMSWLLTLL